MKKFCKVFCIVACLMFIASTSFAASILVTWNPVTDPDLAGYNIFDKVGTGPNIKVGTVGVMTTPSFTIPNVPDGFHVITVTAFDGSGNESLPSDPASGNVDSVPPAKPTKPIITISK